MRIKKQTDVKDCGVNVIQSLHHHYFKQWKNLNQFKHKVKYGEKGINIKNLISLGLDFGIEMEAYEVDVDSISHNAKGEIFVGIVESQAMMHYVIFKINNDKVYITDPMKGNYTLSVFEFKKIYKGMAISVEKTDYIDTNIDITNPMKYLAKNATIVSWIIITIIISITLIFISSVFMKILMDKIIPGGAKNMLTILAISFVFIAVIRSVNILLKSYLVEKLTLNIDKELTYLFYNKLSSSSSADMMKLTNNDKLRRLGIISHTSGFIANGIFVLFNEFVMFLIATALLIWVSPSLFAISFLATGLIIATTVIFRLFVRTKFDDLISGQEEIMNSFVDVSNMNRQMKYSKTSDYIGGKFRSSYRKFKKREYEIWTFHNIQGVIENIVIFATPILIAYFGTEMVLQNKMTVGSMLMFIAIFNHFIHPVKDIADFFFVLPQQMKNIELISFVVNMEDEGTNPDGLKLSKLKTIEINNLSVGYDRELFKVKHLVIKDSLRLTGSNGAGKSTLAKAISTTLAAQGEILFNKYDRDFYSLDDIREKSINVSNDMHMPNTTVLEWITLGDKDAIKTFLRNLERYNLVSLLEKASISLEMPLRNNASNVSSGQKQIINILRLFAFKYELIILDEAFENVDRKNIKFLSNRILDYQDSIFVEISHSKKYLTTGKEVDIEDIT
ncbi:MAG: ATP-binding cassette domain-containing protein [Mycoplasmataceae bacterium]|nr:ATP-binding cassette domain-containing protein [Mycoplasmataceae bacterium]